MLEILAKNLKNLGYEVSVFKNADEARDYLCGAINGKSVGIGGSVSAAQMGLADALGTHNEIFTHNAVMDREKSLEMRRRAASADIYISSVNGIALTGEIINIDGNCNRVSATLYGHKKVYFIVGKNKVAEDYDAALWRARNIAAPLNAKRLGRKTPCAEKGDRCYNCHSPERICRALCVLWEKPSCGDFEVVLVDQELGY